MDVTHMSVTLQDLGLANRKSRLISTTQPTLRCSTLLTMKTTSEKILPA